jgi:hypothetical protein
MVKIGWQEGLGKNYLADCYLSECQRIYGNDAKLFIITAEYPYDKLRARDNGVRIALTRDEVDSLEASLHRKLDADERKELMSQTGEIILTHGLGMEESLETVLKCLDSDLFQIGLVDSMDSLLPAVQEERDIGDPKVAASAIVQTDFMKKFHKVIGRVRRTLLLTLGQARANIPTAGARVFKTARVNDPWAVKHGLAGKVTLTPGGPIKDGKRQIGKIINWQIEKGKAGFHDGPTGSLEYFYSSGVNKLKDFVEVAKGYVERRGAYYYLSSELTGGQAKQLKGLDELSIYFRNNPEKMESVQRYIYEQANITCMHNENEKKASRQGRAQAGKKAKGKNHP